jgi:hypothetical protein
MYSKGANMNPNIRNEIMFFNSFCRYVFKIMSVDEPLDPKSNRNKTI